MSEFNGFGLNLGNLSQLSDAQTRSISAENFTGEKGKGRAISTMPSIAILARWNRSAMMIPRVAGRELEQLRREVPCRISGRWRAGQPVRRRGLPPRRVSAMKV